MRPGEKALAMGSFGQGKTTRIARLTQESPRYWCFDTNGELKGFEGVAYDLRAAWELYRQTGRAVYRPPRAAPDRDFEAWCRLAAHARSTALFVDEVGIAMPRPRGDNPGFSALLRTCHKPEFGQNSLYMTLHRAADLPVLGRYVQHKFIFAFWEPQDLDSIARVAGKDGAEVVRTLQPFHCLYLGPQGRRLILKPV